MNLKEAKLIAEVLADVDSGCPHCVSEACERMNRRFPNYVWALNWLNEEDPDYEALKDECDVIVLAATHPRAAEAREDGVLRTPERPREAKFNIGVCTVDNVGEKSSDWHNVPADKNGMTMFDLEIDVTGHMTSLSVEVSDLDGNTLESFETPLNPPQAKYRRLTIPARESISRLKDGLFRRYFERLED